VPLNASLGAKALRRTPCELRTAPYHTGEVLHLHDDSLQIRRCDRKLALYLDSSRNLLNVLVTLRLPLRFVGPRLCCISMHQSRSQSSTLLHGHDNVVALQHLNQVPHTCRDMVAMSSICTSYQKSAPATWPLGLFRSNGQTKGKLRRIVRLVEPFTVCEMAPDRYRSS
jgi:hypothetical protein